MMNKIKLIILLLFLLVIQLIDCHLIDDESINNQNEVIVCNERNRNKLDESLTQISGFGDLYREYPSTRDQMNGYCM